MITCFHFTLVKWKMESEPENAARQELPGPRSLDGRCCHQHKLSFLSVTQ